MGRDGRHSTLAIGKKMSRWLTGVVVVGAGVMIALYRVGDGNSSWRAGGTADDTGMVPANLHRPPQSAMDASHPEFLESLPMDATAGWVVVDLNSDSPIQTPGGGDIAEDAVLVALAQEMWRWEAGDKISLSVPQIGVTYTSTVDAVENAAGGIRTYTGKLTKGEFPYSFVVTVGETKAFANLGTPKGTYEMFGDTEFGWLYRTPAWECTVGHSEAEERGHPNGIAYSGLVER